MAHLRHFALCGVACLESLLQDCLWPPQREAPGVGSARPLQAPAADTMGTSVVVLMQVIVWVVRPRLRPGLPICAGEYWVVWRRALWARLPLGASWVY